MQQNRMMVLTVGLVVVAFLACGGLALVIYNVARDKDTSRQVRGTTPETSKETTSRPTEPAKPTTPASMPKILPPPPTGILGPKKGEMPTEAELRQLVTNTLLDLDQGIKMQDFTNFHGKLAANYQRGTTPKALQGNFQNFINNKLDLSPVKEVAPKFDPAPALGADGVLSLAGEFPAKNLRVGFKLQYVFEGNTWKLTGRDFSLNVQQTMGDPME